VQVHVLGDRVVTELAHSLTCAHHLLIILKNSKATAQASTVSGSTTVIEYVLNGSKTMHSTLRLLITIRRNSMTETDFPPLHPGEVLLEEFLKPLKLSQHQLAMNMRVSPQKINDIVRCKRGITADTALRLALALNTTPEFWLGLQMDYDLETAKDSRGKQIEKEVIPVD
jgi:antitoxin HigA-1